MVPQRAGDSAARRRDARARAMRAGGRQLRAGADADGDLFHARGDATPPSLLFPLPPTLL